MELGLAKLFFKAAKITVGDWALFFLAVKDQRDICVNRFWERELIHKDNIPIHKPSKQVLINQLNVYREMYIAKKPKNQK